MTRRPSPTNTLHHQRCDMQEYTDQERLKGLVSKYSEFISFPIYLQTTAEKEVPVEEEEEPAAAAEDKDSKAADDDDDDDDGDVVDDTDEDAKPKTEKRNVTEWSHLNDNKPIWLRPASDISEDDYNSFYHSISKGKEDPLRHIHFRGEGDVEFKALLFVPKKAPWDYYDQLQVWGCYFW
jgi:heat shock protein 90kDa beta